MGQEGTERGVGVEVSKDAVTGDRQSTVYRSCNLRKRPSLRCEHLTRDQGRTSPGEGTISPRKVRLIDRSICRAGVPQASTDGPTSLEEDQAAADFLAELARGLTPRTPTHGTPRPPHSPVHEANPSGKGPRKYSLQRAFG